MEQINEAVEAIAREIGLDAQEISLRKSFLEIGASDVTLLLPVHQRPVAAAWCGCLLSFPFFAQPSPVNTRKFRRPRRCDKIQGFHFTRPLPATAVTRSLQPGGSRRLAMGA